ncbi:MAG: Fic family protein, partial [Bacteroidota bacterium]
ILDMVEHTAKSARTRISRIEIAMHKMSDEIQNTLPKIYSKDLVELLFHLPYTKRNFLVRAGIGNIKTSGNYLKNLEMNGFLKAMNVGKEKLYLNFRLMEILQTEI